MASLFLHPKDAIQREEFIPSRASIMHYLKETSSLALDALPEPEAESEEEAEQALLDDWQAFSYRALWEIWDNESDAVYDSL